MTFGDELTINDVVYVFVDFRLIRRATGYSGSLCTFCHVGDLEVLAARRTQETNDSIV